MRRRGGGSDQRAGESQPGPSVHRRQERHPGGHQDRRDAGRVQARRDRELHARRRPRPDGGRGVEPREPVEAGAGRGLADRPLGGALLAQDRPLHHRRRHLAERALLRARLQGSRLRRDALRHGHPLGALGDRIGAGADLGRLHGRRLAHGRRGDRQGDLRRGTPALDEQHVRPRRGGPGGDPPQRPRGAGSGQRAAVLLEPRALQGARGLRPRRHAGRPLPRERHQPARRRGPRPPGVLPRRGRHGRACGEGRQAAGRVLPARGLGDDARPAPVRRIVVRRPGERRDRRSTGATREARSC